MQNAQFDDLKRDARAADPAVRAAVAARQDAPPELLYFLAQDEDGSVRRAAAGNPALPAKANTLLTQDPDHDVRVALAYKMVGDGLGSEERSKMLRMGLTILEALATDQVVRVRAALSRALSRVKEAPRVVVLGLAKDAEEEVATPVLEHSPVLTEDDLKDLLAGNPPEWLKAAIGRRDYVPGTIVDLIVDDEDVRPVATVVGNPAAEIRPATMERIVAAAPGVEAWHEPLVRREDMPEGLLVKLAKFVAAPLLSVIQGREGLSAATVQAVQEAAGGRDDPGGQARDTSGGPSGEQRAAEMFQRGALDEDTVAAALDKDDKSFVTAALALRAGVTFAAAQRVIKAGNARVITALVWKAGMPMRFALDVQRFLGRVPAREQLYARNGVDYPLSDGEMTMLVETFAG